MSESWRRKIAYGLGVALTALGLVSCKQQAGPQVPVPNDVTLAMGEHVTLTPDRVELGFRKVDGDSRCPRSVKCIWAGEAGVQLWLLRPSVPDSVFAKITLGPDTTTTVESLGYKITATKLDPYPEQPGPIPQSAYRVSLHVEKTGG
jgi:hypothetical protein